MEIRQNWNPIKLKAVDDQDLQVFSQFMYEAIVLPSEINFEKKKQQFAMAIERFTWEHAKDKSHLLMQVLSILVINYVEKVDSYLNKMRLKCLQYKIDLIEVDINKGYDQIITSYLLKRQKIF